MILRDYLANAMSYEEYREVLDRMVKLGKTTGDEQSESRINFTKLNLSRVRRWEKTFKPDPEVVEALKDLPENEIWLIITETWCGDAAQNIPIIEKLAAATDTVETKYVLRDENPELMDAFLTNGARSIPKLIRIDASTQEVIGTWGPRANHIQDLVMDWKHNQKLDHDVWSEMLHSWYFQDKGREIQKEFLSLSQQTANLSC